MISLVSCPNDIHLNLEDFQVVWNAGTKSLQITTKDGKVLWSTVPGQGFITASTVKGNITETRGYFFSKEKVVDRTSSQSIDTIEAIDNKVRITGSLGGGHPCRYRVTIKPRGDRLLKMIVTLQSEHTYNHTTLSFATAKDNQIFGFGEQLTHLNLKGRRFTSLSQEPGIGRGIQPLTFLMNL